MLGILSLGVCIACVSCLCCLCTATVVAAPGLIDLRTGLLLCGKRECEESRRKSEEILPPDVGKTAPCRNGSSVDASESETCPCSVTYVLDPILRSTYAKNPCGGFVEGKKPCKCPSFLDLVGNASGLSGKVLPRS